MFKQTNSTENSVSSSLKPIAHLIQLDDYKGFHLISYFIFEWLKSAIELTKIELFSTCSSQSLQRVSGLIDHIAEIPVSSLDHHSSRQLSEMNLILSTCKLYLSIKSYSSSVVLSFIQSDNSHDLDVCLRDYGEVLEEYCSADHDKTVIRKPAETLQDNRMSSALQIEYNAQYKFMLAVQKLYHNAPLECAFPELKLAFTYLMLNDNCMNNNTDDFEID